MVMIMIIMRTIKNMMMLMMMTMKNMMMMLMMMMMMRLADFCIVLSWGLSWSYPDPPSFMFLSLFKLFYLFYL